MVIITVGEAVQACLGGLTEPVELRGTDGTVLGYFAPLTESTARRYAAARAHFDPEITRRRGADNAPRYTTAEVIKRMEAQDDVR